MGARRESRRGPLHDPAYRELCILLRRWREDAGLSQRDLAGRLGKIHTYVAKSEQGERRIDPIEFVRWVRACGLVPSESLLKVCEIVD